MQPVPAPQDAHAAPPVPHAVPLGTLLLVLAHTEAPVEHPATPVEISRDKASHLPRAPAAFT